MRTKLTLFTVGAVAAGVAYAGAASAYTWSDPVNGVGHVGKGEVQSAFGWNDRQIQNAYKANSIKFSVTDYETWSQACTSRKKTVTLTATRDRTRADSAVGVDAENNQITSSTLGALSGFALTGWGDTLHVTSGWGTNPWQYDTNNGCPAGTKPNGAPTRTTWTGPLQVTSTPGTKDLTLG